MYSTWFGIKRDLAVAAMYWKFTDEEDIGSIL